MASIFWVAGNSEDPSPNAVKHSVRLKIRYLRDLRCWRRHFGARKTSQNPQFTSRKYLTALPLTRPSGTLSPPRGARGKKGREDHLGIGPQRIEPVDDEAPQPGIGAVLQQRPDLPGMAQPDQ